MEFNKYELLVILVEKIMNRVISPHTDLTWSSYNNVTDLIDELKIIILKLKCKDEQAIQALSLFFAPTGPLQEISLASGWGEEFLEISKEYDLISKKI